MASDEGQWGRRLSPDPLGGDITNPQSLNRYAYVLNNPTTLTDPSGLATCYDSQGDAFSCPDPIGTSVTVTANVGPGDPMLQLIFDIADCLNPLSGCPLESTQSQKAPAPAPKPAPPSTGFTLGLRLSNQTFNQCMTQNASNYSAGGAIDLVFGLNDFGRSSGGQFFAGNTFTGAYAGIFGGSLSATSGAAASTSPDLLETAMGSPLTYGRRTADIMALNLEGKGGLPLALSPVPEIGEIKSVLGSASKGLNLGLDAATKGAIDAGLFGAEMFGCSISQ